MAAAAGQAPTVHHAALGDVKGPRVLSHCLRDELFRAITSSGTKTSLPPVNSQEPLAAPPHAPPSPTADGIRRQGGQGALCLPELTLTAGVGGAHPRRGRWGGERNIPFAPRCRRLLMASPRCALDRCRLSLHDGRVVPAEQCRPKKKLVLLEPILTGPEKLDRPT